MNVELRSSTRDPRPTHRYLELSAQTVMGAVWQNLDLERYAAAYGVRLQPLVVEQHNDLGDGLVREWIRADTGVNTHRAYALQWFVMSGAIAILYVAYRVRESRKPQSGN